MLSIGYVQALAILIFIDIIDTKMLEPGGRGGGGGKTWAEIDTK